jgi:hypothetical protein
MHRWMQNTALILLGMLLGSALMRERVAVADWNSPGQGDTRLLERLVKASEDSVRELRRVAGAQEEIARRR